MYELQCPACNKPSHYNFSDYLLLCPFCSASFHYDSDKGQKDIFRDHYIVPNGLDSGTVKELALEWLRRMSHAPGSVQKEYFVTDVKGYSMPMWIVSLEAFTAWKGLVKKQSRYISSHSGSDFLNEVGHFRRSYRWAVSGRNNICETWGLTRLHEPTENIQVEWDGFPFDSTFTRGRLTDDELKTAYESRNFFEFKYANGLPILGIQVEEEEGLRRAKNHVELYHYKIACLNADYLIDYRTEVEIAGIQLVHVPIWKVVYQYRPKGFLRHFTKMREKHMVLDGHGRGVLAGELAVMYHDKILINAIISGIVSVLLFLVGLGWHPAFYLVSLFAAAISFISFYLSMQKKTEKEEEELRKLSAYSGLGTSPSQKTANAKA